MKWYYYVILLLLIMVGLQECTKEKQETEQPVMFQDLRLKIDTAESQQGIIIEKQVYISGKTKTLTKIKYLHDTVEIIKVCLEKENLLDSLVIVSDSLVNSICRMDKLRNKQDSIFQDHINCQSAIIDSLEKSPKKYIKGLKHGLVLGAIVGLIIPQK